MKLENKNLKTEFDNNNLKNKESLDYYLKNIELYKQENERLLAKINFIEEEKQTEIFDLKNLLSNTKKGFMENDIINIENQRTFNELNNSIMNKEISKLKDENQNLRNSLDNYEKKYNLNSEKIRNFDLKEQEYSLKISNFSEKVFTLKNQNSFFKKTEEESLYENNLSNPLKKIEFLLLSTEKLQNLVKNLERENELLIKNTKKIENWCKREKIEIEVKIEEINFDYNQKLLALENENQRIVTILFQKQNELEFWKKQFADIEHSKGIDSEIMESFYKKMDFFKNQMISKFVSYFFKK